MKLKLVIISLFALSACADFDKFIDDTSDLKNQTSSLFGGSIEKATPAEICKQYHENSMNANRRYIGKTIEPTGKILKIYKDDFSRLRARNSILENTYRIVMQTGSERINVGMSSSMAVKNLKVGQTVKMNGQISSLGGDDTGDTCVVTLRHAVPK